MNTRPPFPHIARASREERRRRAGARFRDFTLSPAEPKCRTESAAKKRLAEQAASELGEFDRVSGMCHVQLRPKTRHTVMNKKIQQLRGDEKIDEYVKLINGLYPEDIVVGAYTNHNR